MCMLSGPGWRANPIPPYRTAIPLQDQVCYGMYNQATVHQYRAEFALFKAAREGQPASSVAEQAEAHLKASLISTSYLACQAAQGGNRHGLVCKHPCIGPG